jgi:hypothetical protein
MPETKNALHARCSDKACGHEWIVAYLPMQMDLVALLASRAACPKCANTKPLVKMS